MLDHGTLNLPLTKRGNIDAQIDRYKAQQRKTAAAQNKERAQRTREARATAKTLVEQISDERLEHLAAHCGVTKAAMRRQLTSDAHWQPHFIIKLLGE